MCTFSVSDVIYHKFSHGAASYTLSEENVNVMLEFKDNFPNFSMKAYLVTTHKNHLILMNLSQHMSFRTKKEKTLDYQCKLLLFGAMKFGQKQFCVLTEPR